MNKRYLMAVLVTSTVLLCMAPSGCAKVMKIPGAKVRVVDAGTGQPLEWVHVGYDAGKTVYDVAGEGYAPVYIAKDFFFQANDGWITLEAAESMSLTLQSVSCRVTFESPGYELVAYDCDELRRLSKIDSDGVILHLKRSWNALHVSNQALHPILVGGEVLSPNSFQARMFRLCAYETLMQHWDEFLQKDPKGCSLGYLLYLENYLGAYKKGSLDPKDLEINNRVCEFFYSEYANHVSVHTTLRGFIEGSRTSSDFLREAPCAKP